MDPRIANTVGYLSATLLRALEVGDIEERLADLEAIVKHPPAGESPFAIDPVPEMPEPAGGTAA